MKKRIVALFLAVMMIFSLLPVSAFAEEPAEIVASGYCGGDTKAEYDSASKSYKNLTWTLDSEGTLTICGEGAMMDYTTYSSVPWYSIRSTIKTAVIADCVQNVGSYAFFKCSNLTSVTIPDSVTSIGEHAFYSCGFVSVSIPDSVTSIGKSAFRGCNRLKSITIPDSVTSIGELSFCECYDLTSITIPLCVTSIGDNAFYYTAYYNNSKNWNNGLLYIGNYLINSEIDITSADIIYGTKLIADETFANCHYLTSVTIPDSVTSIGDNAFENCKKLTSVTIPDSVTSIGDHAFHFCENLPSVTIPDNVTSIGKYAFYGCLNLKSAKFLGDAPREFGEKVFDNCASGFTILAPKYNNTWTESAFYNESEQTWHGYPIVFYGETPDVPEIIASGYCGGDTKAEYDEASDAYKNLTWTLDGEGTLTISGDGEMKNFYLTSAPWGQYKENIRSVVIGDGVKSIGNFAFYRYQNLICVTIGDGVTSIGTCSFNNCSALTSVDIPVGVTKIGDQSFEDCENLTEVIIPNGVTEIGSCAFDNCRNLKSIIIPDSVTSIEHLAFFGCESLTSLTIGNGVTDIGSQSFENCISLTNLIIPDSVTSIGGSAFADCSSLTSLTIGNGVRVIREDAFMGCSSLTSLLIPDSVHIIGGGAFFYCSSLKSVIIGSGVHSIGDGAFECCGNLESVAIPDNVTNIGDNAFYGCEKLADEDGFLIIRNVLIDYFGEGGSIIIPSGVTHIGAYAFNGCTSLTSVAIPNSVTSIGGYAFIYCNNLTSVTIPDSVTNIGEWAFYGCSGLTSVILSNNMLSIGASTFYGCRSLTSVAIPDSVTSIGHCAFSDTALYNNSANWEKNILYIDNCLIDAKNTVVEAHIKEGTRLIANEAFYECTSLTSVTIPNGLISIGDWSFYGCSNLKDINIPNGIERIGARAFDGCSSLTRVIIPDSVTSIGGGAFLNCKKLANIAIGRNVQSIGSSAFEGTDYYNDYNNWEDGILYINDCLIVSRDTLTVANIKYGTRIISDHAFDKRTSSGSALSSVTIPNSVTNIGVYAFAGCTMLTNILIPSSVASIDEGAFYWCTSLESVDIPKSVTSIGIDAFRDCCKLASARFECDAPLTFGRHSFAACADDFKILAPRGNSTWLGDAYNVTTQTWNGYPIKFYGHSYTATVTAPTCLNRGYTTHICLECGDSYVDNYTDPLGHNFVDGACTRCDATNYIASGFCGGDETAEYDEASGAYKNARWGLDENGTLTVSGTGALMRGDTQTVPWYEYIEDIKTVKVKEGISCINVFTFAELYYLENVILPDSLECIYAYAFVYAGALGQGTFEHVYIPKNVRCIQPMAFVGCFNLKSIEIAEDNPYLTSNGLTVYTKDMKNLVISETKDTELVIPDGVKGIYIGAFYYNEYIENITIPASVEAIDLSAFVACPNLEYAKFEGDAPSRAAFCAPENFVAEGIFEGEENPDFVPEEIFDECAPNFKILAPAGNKTWTGEGYDAEAQTWYGYPIEFYGEVPVTSGNCGGDGDGSNMTWEVTPDGTLIISGSGSMADYNDATDTPWKDYIDKITEVVINADVTDIDLSAFDGMYNLENISISGKNRVFSSINGVVYNKNANELLYCPRGKTGEYEVHGGLKVIKANAFANCTKLTAIVIANSITTVEDNAFKGCKSLKVAAFTDSEPKNVGKAIFDNCAPDFTVSAVNSNGKWLKSARYDAKTHTWNGYPIVFGERTIVDSDNSGDTRWDVDKYGNLIIGSDGEMSGSTDLSGISADIKTAVIGEGTTSIAEDLFAGCENLEAVIIPDSVTEIGSGAFADCESLAAVEISSNVDNIGAGAFEGCRGLTEINVSDNNPNYCSVDGKLYNKDMTELIWVPEGAADDSITVPASVKTIGDGAFSGCEALEEVTLFEGLTEIGDGAFAGCENLSTVNVQRLAPKLMVKALFAANSIAADEVTKLPESVVRIGSEAFAGCSGISAMNISRTVREIGSRAFANCENLLAINVDENNTVYCSVDGVLYSKDMSVLICMPAGLTGVYEIPESVISIADGAFCGCTENLKVKADEKFISCDFGGCIVCFGEDGYSYVNVVTPASCTEEGYTQLVRNDGVKGEKTNFTPAAGHKFGAWTVITAADCSNDGIATRTCAVCGESETRTIPHGHEFTYIVNAASCTSEELTVYTCSVCGYSYEEITGEKLDHALAHHDGKAATCTEAGWEAYDTCENCDYTTYKDIPAKGHSYGQPTFVWDGFKCSAYVACSCGDTQSVKCTVTSEVTSEATTKSEGVRTYTAAVTVDGQTYTSTKTESIPKLPDSGTNIIVEIITTIVNAITGIFKTIASWFR